MLSAAIAKDWADVLEGLPQNYIDRACIRYLREEPKRKPTPGAIYRLVLEMMPRPSVVPAAPEPEPRHVPPDMAERAIKILAEVSAKRQ